MSEVEVKEFLVPPSGRVEVGHPSWEWYLKNRKHVDRFLTLHDIDVNFTYAVLFDEDGMTVYQFGRDSNGNLMKDRLSGEPLRLRPQRILYRYPVVY